MRLIEGNPRKIEKRGKEDMKSLLHHDKDLIPVEGKRRNKAGWEDTFTGLQ
jgi:hypothetical protein